MKMKKNRRLLLLIVFTLVSFFLYLFMFTTAGGHFFNRNYMEVARRYQCLNSLNMIAAKIDESEIEITKENIQAIQKIVDELNYTCPSGYKVGNDESICGYFVEITSSDNLVITEHKDNHNTEK